MWRRTVNGGDYAETTNRRLAAAVALAACSSSSKKPTAASTGSSTGKAPVKIAFFGIETGPSSTPATNNMVDLAVKQLNASGGIDGRPVQITHYDSGLLPDTGVTAVEKALENHPTVMIGLSFTAQLQAVAALVKSSGIPFLTTGQSSTLDYSLLKVPNVFRVVPDSNASAIAAADYVAGLKPAPKTVGVVAVAGPGYAAPTVGTLFQQQLQKNGFANFIDRALLVGATDATEQVLAMKNADFVLVWGLPTVDEMFLKGANQNGEHPEILLDSGGASDLAFGLSTQQELSKSSYDAICDPEAEHNTIDTAFVTAYHNAYGANTDTASGAPYNYDAVMLAASAIKKAGSTAGPDITKALDGISYSGVCGTYKNDPEHNMAQFSTIVSLGQGLGHKQVVASFKNIPSLPPVTALKALAGA